VPGFDSIKYQDLAIHILTTFLHNGTIPHALLFTGTEGVGKESAAVAFAMACNCTADSRVKKKRAGESTRRANDFAVEAARMTTTPCCDCKSCRKIRANNHPDIIRVKPSGPFIKIDQIRSLCQILAMRPYEASTRVVIIADAQAMNPAASNALLKVLEEPPVRTILILVALHTSDLLPTVVSRCQHIRFKPIACKNLESILVHDQKMDPANAMIIAAMAGGSISKALRMYRSDWINRRNWIVSELDSLSAGPTSRLLAFADQLAKNKADIPDSLEVMKAWLRDLVIQKLNPEKITNRDLAAQVKNSSPKMSMASLFEKINMIQSTEYSIQAGTNLRLAMEALVLKLARI
jgi:DNA polymerase-3 subunit delta'